MLAINTENFNRKGRGTPFFPKKNGKNTIRFFKTLFFPKKMAKTRLVFLKPFLTGPLKRFKTIIIGAKKNKEKNHESISHNK